MKNLEHNPEKMGHNFTPASQDHVITTWVGKIGYQRLKGNQLDTGNNWTTFNTTD